MKARVYRDIMKRKLVVEKETELQVYRYMSRNTQLPVRARMMAQLALANTDKNAFPTNVRNRCLETGRGRGIMSDWRLCRFQFRLKALKGDLSGVQKASW
ncbi:putative 37S ribosomal protein mrp2, mitochondrial [Smittium culicis]|uniref:Putative 37S ribosomal protein mrp2, mitochondrial n=2 Tax=Smittium culicis TaxID=133412 RepID=A0A1R1X1Y1_9FUNG|nr:putative 37S ribosomal protein mrp2, mitochondrial [Smittium culicis]OMJ22890.1 putative 37S ribosomal protein mrp2, mitochondrial [Smittium culicis]OMJ28490.1 putative 37S ribosomal protein mrp2, mitochondrial [Smittium culicis]